MTTNPDPELGSQVLEQAVQHPSDAGDQMVRAEPFGDEVDLEERPIEEWTAGELEQSAVELVEEIDLSERSLTWSYLKLGETLTFLRPKHGHGDWLPYLERLRITKTRWQVAKAIYDTFHDDPSECINLTVAEAYEARERKQQQDHSVSSKRQRTTAKRGQKESAPFTPQHTEDAETNDSQGTDFETVSDSSGDDDISFPIDGNSLDTQGDELDDTVAAEFVVGQMFDSEDDDSAHDGFEAFLEFARSVLIEDEPQDAFLVYLDTFDCDKSKAEVVLDAAIAKLQDVFSAESELVEDSDD